MNYLLLVFADTWRLLLRYAPGNADRREDKLKRLRSEYADAVVNYFDKYDPERASAHDKVSVWILHAKHMRQHTPRSITRLEVGQRNVSTQDRPPHKLDLAPFQHKIDVNTSQTLYASTQDRPQHELDQARPRKHIRHHRLDLVCVNTR